MTVNSSVKITYLKNSMHLRKHLSILCIQLTKSDISNRVTTNVLTSMFFNPFLLCHCPCPAHISFCVLSYLLLHMCYKLNGCVCLDATLPSLRFVSVTVEFTMHSERQIQSWVEQENANSAAAVKHSGFSAEPQLFSGVG